MNQANSLLSTVSMVAYCLIVSGSLTSPSAAEEVSLTGTWVHEASVAEAAKRDEAIDHATQALGFLMRDRASEHLREATQPSKELSLTKEKDQVTFVSNGRPIRMTIDGPPAQVSGERGEGTAQARFKDGRLAIIAQAEAGTRTTVFHLSDNGKRLVLQITLISQKLGAPIRYSETYIRR